MSIEFSTQRRLPTTAAERERLLAKASFGQTFTDHMVTIRWSDTAGWHDAQLTGYGPLVLDPSAQVFHYGQEVFEGVKAYRRVDGSIMAFRPLAHAERLNRSCHRMAMPPLPPDTFLEALELLIGTDADWVPDAPGHSLYLRPFMIATQPSLGFYRRSAEYLFVMLASPAGAYFSGGVRPVSVWWSTGYTRAAPGGTGAAKCGGNYAGTLLAQEEAVEMGCDQVVWLDAVEHRWIEELGTSNLFFVYGTTLITPPLTGTALAGITRDSVLALAADLGYSAVEQPLSIEQWQADAESGELTEAFSCGTSSMITPVGEVRGSSTQWHMGDGSPGPVTMRIREELMGIQFGQRPDPHGWMHKVL
jgi:branched-chain amino acid aminotransferase